MSSDLSYPEAFLNLAALHTVSKYSPVLQWSLTSGLSSHTACLGSQSPPITGCEVLDKFLHLPLPRLTCPRNGDNTKLIWEN